MLAGVGRGVRLAAAPFEITASSRQHIRDVRKPRKCAAFPKFLFILVAMLLGQHLFPCTTQPDGLHWRSARAYGFRIIDQGHRASESQALACYFQPRTMRERNNGCLCGGDLAMWYQTDAEAFGPRAPYLQTSPLTLSLTVLHPLTHNSPSCSLPPTSASAPTIPNTTTGHLDPLRIPSPSAL